MKNSIRHGWVGLIAGFVLGISHHSLAWFAAWIWCLAWALLFLAATLGLELWQWRRSGLEMGEYWALKSKDTIADILVGNLAFNIPLWVLACGIYAGNILR
jgi:hypothetical protein